MAETWARWEPIAGLSAKYFIDSVSDGVNGFKVILSEIHNRKKQVSIVFENSVDLYRNADETYRYQLVLELDEKYGEDFYGDWTFFKVTNSSYLEWVSESSCTISDTRNLKHFSILAGNQVLDIVTCYEPKVEIIKLPLP